MEIYIVILLVIIFIFAVLLFVSINDSDKKDIIIEDEKRDNLSLRIENKDLKAKNDLYINMFKL